MKKGDKVQIKSREWYDANKDSEGHIVNVDGDGGMFVPPMADYCGKIFVVEKENAMYQNWHSLSGIPFAWHISMFTEVVISELKPIPRSVQKARIQRLVNQRLIRSINAWTK